MKEIREIISSHEQYVSLGIRCALATVISVEGSTYRRPGARMLISEEGVLTGAISGGCLEGDAMKKALLVINSQQSALVTYDTMDEDDAIIGVGLGCQGIIKILIEPIDDSNSENPIQVLKFIQQSRKAHTVATSFCKNEKKQNHCGTKLCIDETGQVFGSLEDEDLRNVMINHYQYVVKHKKSLWVDYIVQNSVRCAFLEFIPPAIRLVIVGAGNDVKPLTEMASVIGWDTIIVDGRANYAKQERFPTACSIHIAKPEQALNHLSLDSYCYFVLMTHNYKYEKALLKALSLTNQHYIGLLGPRKKLERMLQELEHEGHTLSTQQINAIYSPVGLDIGAETSEEIALSIIAEIKAVHESKRSTHLRAKSSSIHA